MNAEQLLETTMDPERRILKKVIIDDHDPAQRRIELNGYNDLFEVLMGDDVPPRREFIEKNAKYAKIDV